MHFLQRGQGDFVFDHQRAEGQAAAHDAGVALQNLAGVQVRNEQFWLLGAQHQAVPQLLAAERVQKRVHRIVDFDEMFEFHGADFQKNRAAASRMA